MKISSLFERSTIVAGIMIISVPAVGLVSVAARADNAPVSSDDNKVMPDGTKIICKKTSETGSIVKKTKRCYTRVQWDRISEAARGNAQRMQSDHASGLVSN